MKRKIPWHALLCLLLAGCTPSATQDLDAAADLPGHTISTEISEVNDQGGIASNQISPPDAQKLYSSENTPDGETVSIPEEHVISLETLLKTALLPVGETAYVWGGGWNEEDTGAGPEATSIGVSPRWKEFADDLSSDYDHEKYRYQIHDGLDCSGYVGWILYNVFETEEGKPGFVYSSSETAKTYADLGFGDYLPAKEVRNWRAGDVASMDGHVWLCLGTCADGSVLLVHSSPPGVRICGTLKNGKVSDAVRLAEDLMKNHYSNWYERFPDCSVKQTYLKKSSQMRWNEETFPDAAQIQALSAEEIAKLLFSE